MMIIMGSAWEENVNVPGALQVGVGVLLLLRNRDLLCFLCLQSRCGVELPSLRVGVGIRLLF